MVLSKLFPIALAVELATDIFSPFPIFSFFFEVLIFRKLGFKSLFILNSMTYVMYLIKYNSVLSIGASFLPSTSMSFSYTSLFIMITSFGLAIGFLVTIFVMIVLEFIVYHILRFIFPKVIKRIEGNILA
jgi:hypothetical protein